VFPAASIPIFPGILRWNGQDREPILSAMSGGEFSCGPNVTIATIRPRRADGFIDGRNKSLGSLQPLHTSESSSPASTVVTMHVRRPTQDSVFCSVYTCPIQQY